MWIENAIKTAFNQVYIQFTLQLLISEYIFFFRKEKRSWSKIRYVGSVISLFLAGYMWTRMIVTNLPEDSVLGAMSFLGFAVLTFGWIIFNYDVTAMETLFIVAGGYATEHIAFCVTRIMLYIVMKCKGTVFDYEKMYDPFQSTIFFSLCTKILPYIIVAYVVYALIVKNNDDKIEFRRRDYKIIVLSLVLMVVAVLLSQCYSQRRYWNSFLSAVVCPLYGGYFLYIGFNHGLLYFMDTENAV